MNTGMHSDEYEDISIEFMDKHKRKYFIARYFPNRQIATICETYDKPDGTIGIKITQPGMNREELLKYFSKNDGSINTEFLIRSIMYEAYIKEGLTGTIDGGNVRHFWYTHLKTIIVRILGKNDDDSISSAINRAWGCAIDSKAVTYEEMGIYSDKESGRLSIVKDSPFNNIIIAVEKQNFFDTFNWMPRLFNCTLITAGGQPSRAVARRFIFELKNDGVNLDQTFHMCIASDLDPAGYYIQEAFKNQFDKAIDFYGGTGKIEIHRLFVRKDQVTDELLEAQGIAWNPNKDKKSTETIWSKFCNKTNGGLYIPKPDGWQGGTDFIDGKEMVRALLEMDAFSTSIIERSFVRELLKIIRATNDETKIMIPELMRIFNDIKDSISEELFDEWNDKLIEPLKKEFLKDTKEWKDFIEDTKERRTDDVNEEYDNEIELKNEEKRIREPELFNDKDNFEEIIDVLKEERDEKIREIEEEYKDQLRGSRYELEDVNEEIDERCKDIDEEIEDLEEERTEELEQIEDDYNFRIKKYNDFNEEHIAVFNPVEQGLMNDIKQKLMDLDYRFKTLELRDEIKKEIAGLCINTDLLLKNNISCFEHPTPAFYGENLLEKASLNKDVHIGNVRDSFSHRLFDGMKQIWRNDTRDFVFELGETIEMQDLSDEVKNAMDTTEQELAEKNNTNEGDDSSGQ